MKYLRLFYFHKEGTSILKDSGEVLTGSSVANPTISDIVEEFFNAHAAQCNNDQKIQNFRFQNRTSQIIQNMLNSFGTVEAFEEHSEYIAEKLKSSLSNNTMRSDFYLVVFSTKIENRDCLCIFRMEANIGIQVTKEITLNTLERMLPDKKSRLQKAAIIFRDETNNFYSQNEPENSERDHVHSKIIDRVDPGISGYFFSNFLDSYRVLDNPESSAQLAIESVANVTERYLCEGISRKDIEDKLRKELSVQKETSFDALVGTISNQIDVAKMENANLDNENLAEQIYTYAKAQNNTVVRTFQAKYRFPPKIRIVDVDEQGSISISFFKALEESEIVTWGDDPNDGDYSILRILKDEVKTL